MTDYTSLSNRELQVLTILMEAKGTWVSAENMARRLFNDAYPLPSEVQNVRGYMARLRKKLGGEAVVTKINCGYRLAAYDECCVLCGQALPVATEYRYA